MDNLFDEFETMKRLGRTPRVIMVSPRIKLDIYPISLNSMQMALNLYGTKLWRSYNCPFHLMLFAEQEVHHDRQSNQK